MRPGRVFLVATLTTGTALAGLGAGGEGDPGRAARVPIERGSQRPARGMSVVAAVRARRLGVYARPGAPRPVRRLSNPTPQGSPRVLLVRRVRGGWIEVSLPVRPSGSKGWVRAGDVTLARNPWRLIVRLGRHRLRVERAGRVVARMRIAAGRAQTPTPRGHFFVAELLRQPDPRGGYGPWVFALSGYSRVITHFRGGRGEIGIHGTNAPHLLGRDVSHGCIRLRNADIDRMARVLPLGTPVDISAN